MVAGGASGGDGAGGSMGGVLTAEPNRYDVVRYPSHPYGFSHPDRLYLVGRLNGMNPVLPANARVLELGCGEGGNLIPMAYRLPGAAFVGVDLAASAIEAGRAIAADLGVGNVRLEVGDIEALGDLGAFDYVICHGVYSWVPASVRARILALCAEVLAPEGLAYISYNTFPGWHLHRVVRDLMRLHAQGFEDAHEQIDQGVAMVRFVAEQVKDSSSPYARVMAEGASRLVLHDPAYLFHEYLSPENQPFYLREVVDDASRAGLAYVGDAWLEGMMPMRLGAGLQALAGRMQDLVQVEQFMDVVQNGSFRRSVFSRADRTLRRRPHEAELDGLFVSLRGELVEGVLPGPLDTQVDDAPVVMTGFDGTPCRVESPVGKAALAALREVSPRSLAWGELVRRATARAGRGGPDEVREVVLHAFSATLVDLVPRRRGLVAEAGRRPRAPQESRYFSSIGARYVPTLRHQGVEAGALLRALLPLLDGTRDRAALVGELVARAVAGDLPVEIGGERVSDVGDLQRHFEAAVDRKLAQLPEWGLIEGDGPGGSL